MALVMGLSFFPVHALAEAATPETALEPSEEQQEQNGAALSDNAAAFLAAVNAFDADAMMRDNCTTTRDLAMIDLFYYSGMRFLLQEMIYSIAFLANSVVTSFS